MVGGVPLGLFDSLPYAEAEVAFGAGDALLMFSDGISEAMDSFQSEFGEDRLEELWRECGHGPGIATIERVMSDVIAFRGSAPQSDDMTTVVIAPATGA
jgi:sigma-B regulation protein RsbU (phosphoserine phosphatase)